jgi:hypothetical protein
MQPVEAVCVNGLNVPVNACPMGVFEVGVFGVIVAYACIAL